MVVWARGGPRVGPEMEEQLVLRGKVRGMWGGAWLRGVMAWVRGKLACGWTRGGQRVRGMGCGW